MAKPPEEWLAQARYDMDTAAYMFKGGRYMYTVFMCHLAIEKALKGMYAEQVGKEPPERIGCPDRDEWKRENQASETKIIGKKSDMAPVQRRNDNKENIDNRDYTGLGWREPARENAS